MNQNLFETLQISPFAKQPELCAVYLDEAHTRGTDLKLPSSYRAAVTLGANLTKDRLVQACMRMRKLGMGQSVVFCVPEEIHHKIAQLLGQRQDMSIEVSDVLTWAISETWADLCRSIPLWAVQGHRFQSHEKYLNDPRLTAKQVKHVLEEEAQSLDMRYRPLTQADQEARQFRGWDLKDPKISQIVDRCREFETINFSSAALSEEQERELAPEIEAERQIERPARVTAYKHSLHRDLEKLVKTGMIDRNSNATMPAFISLGSTTPANHFELRLFPESLRVTRDFARTAKHCSRSHVSDSYQRPVQWIISIPSADNPKEIETLLIISPYEANELITDIEKYSKVSLHLYSPRTNPAFAPLDHLNLYTVGRDFDPLSVPKSLTTQLNLFSGQLYLDTYEEYKGLCDFLGLAWEAAKDGEIIGADGFIENKRGLWNIDRSIVQFLKGLFTRIRRDCRGVEKSHIGRILEGGLLEERDFQRREMGDVMEIG